MKHARFLIKPASGRCNMQCRYCFYENEKENRETADCGMMTPHTAEKLIAQALGEADTISFAFQGGEPTLAGLEFYRQFIAMEQKYRKPGQEIAHIIQTNGTRIDGEWAAFFREHHFLVGLSVDGTRELHDKNRVYKSGRGSYSDVMKALQLLQKTGVETNLLCVVTAQTARKGQSVYQSLKKTGCRYLQFIPCLDPLDEPRGTRPWSLTPELYARFLKTVFDLWYRDWASGMYISVRLFDDYVHLLCGRPSGACSTCGRCGSYFVVESDGGVYPCDFFVLDQWRIGVLGEKSLKELAEGEIGARFRRTGRGHPAECRDCPWLRLCGGGCQRNWVDNGARNYYCPALKEFFRYAAPRLMTIARAEHACCGGF